MINHNILEKIASKCQQPSSIYMLTHTVSLSKKIIKLSYDKSDLKKYILNDLQRFEYKDIIDMYISCYYYDNIKSYFMKYAVDYDSLLEIEDKQLQNKIISIVLDIDDYNDFFNGKSNYYDLDLYGDEYINIVKINIGDEITI